MISVLLSKLVLLVFGTLYPAYASFKTVKNKNVHDYVKWMMYWIVFAAYTLIEVFTDIFLSFWFPFYYELKILFVIWLICPATRGSTYLFKKVINPQLSRHEKALDSYIDSLWDQGYDIVRKIGAQGLDYVAHMVLELLHKGQITAAQFLPKLDGVAQNSAVIQSAEMPTEANGSNDNNLIDDDDFDILYADSVELYSDEMHIASPQHNEANFLTDSESDSYEDKKSTSQKSSKSRPLKVSSKDKGKGRVLRERKKKTDL